MAEVNPIEDRARKAAKIISAPTAYKLCEGCESIVLMKAVTCPSCHGYRFDEAPERVIQQAKVLGSRPATTLCDEDFL